MEPVCLKIIAAVSRDGFIADATSRIPWKVAADVTHFRSSVGRKRVLVGRRTAEQMLGWFRQMREAGQPVEPVVVTHSPLHTFASNGFPPETHWVGSVAAGLALLHKSMQSDAFVIGGGEIYTQALSQVTELILSEMQVELHSGIPFPPVNPSQWQRISEKWHPPTRGDTLASRLVRWQRVPGL